jgi:hypothetical protein
MRQRLSRLTAQKNRFLDAAQNMRDVTRNNASQPTCKLSAVCGALASVAGEMRAKKYVIGVIAF